MIECYVTWRSPACSRGAHHVRSICLPAAFCTLYTWHTWRAMTGPEHWRETDQRWFDHNPHTSSCCSWRWRNGYLCGTLLLSIVWWTISTIIKRIAASCWLTTQISHSIKSWKKKSHCVCASERSGDQADVCCLCPDSRLRQMCCKKNSPREAKWEAFRFSIFHFTQEEEEACLAVNIQKKERKKWKESLHNCVQSFFLFFAASFYCSVWQKW